MSNHTIFKATPSLRLNKRVRKSVLTVLAMAASSAIASPLRASVLTWDADSGTAGAQDGAGNWSAGGGNFRDTGASTDNATFTNGDAVTFGAGSGAAGNVTIDGTVTTNSLTFAAPGSGSYTLINGASTPNLNLSAGAVINVASGVTPTINATITGSNGFTKSGAGTLTLGGANTSLTGTVAINAGRISLTNASALGSAVPITLGDATIQLNTATVTLGAITVPASVTTATISMEQNSATISHSIAGATLSSPLTIKQINTTGTNWNQVTYTSKITGTGGGSGNDTLVFNNLSGSQNYFTTSSGVKHDFLGNVHVKAGSIFVQSGAVGSDNIIPNASMLILDTGSTWRWNAAGFVETVDGLAGAGTMTVLSGTYSLTIDASNASNDGQRIFSGVMNGGGVITKTGAGTQIFSGANTYSGATTISGGKLQLGNAGTTGSLATGSAITNNANLTINRSNAVAQGTDFSAAAIVGSGGFTQAGTGTTTLTAANTYGGGTLVSAGTLLANNATGSATGTGSVTVNGGKFGGTGAITGALTITAGSVSPGGSTIESLATGANTWSGGAKFDLKLSTDGSTGAAGAQWDQLAVGGTLDMSGASTASKVTVNLVTMSSASTTGTLGTWDPNTSHTWPGFVTTTGLTSVAANKFAIDTSAFQNTINGTFSVVPNGNNLDLNYTAAPEPATVGLISLAGLGLLARRRRRRA